MTFPYSHMSRDELISRAELEGDALALALAAELDLAEQEAKGLLASVATAEEKRDEAETDKETAEADLQSAEEAITDALALIPPNTQHKGLKAIREALNAHAL